MIYQHQEDLKSFLKECEIELLKEGNRKSVKYSTSASVPWDSESIKKDNEKLLKSISGKANVYALFAKNTNDKESRLVYIGQTNSKGARTRLTNHLIKKHKKTGAKLNNVIDHVQAGGEIQISWISVDPVSLRHYIEEEIIKKHENILLWNKHGRNKA